MGIHKSDVRSKPTLITESMREEKEKRQTESDREEKSKKESWRG